MKAEKLKRIQRMLWLEMVGVERLVGWLSCKAGNNEKTT